MWKFVLSALSLCGVATGEMESAQSMINAYNALYAAPIVSTSIGYQVNRTSDIYATTVDFAKKYGYPVETHTVITKDGYLLTVHRIPGSPRSPYSAPKQPVLAMHGLFASSDSWVVTGPGRGLGLLLADQGYDVWMGNVRGNFYSRRHVSLSPKNSTFWNFSFHEMGVYDLPAVIDHVLKVTGQKQIFYIGHSMGTTMFFVMSSSRPEYNQKIKLMVALAPAVYIKQLRSNGVHKLLQYFREINSNLKKSGVQELLPRRPQVQRLIGDLCREGKPTLRICISAYLEAFGGVQRNINTAMAHVIFSHVFSGCSINTIAHFVENYETGRFQKFDPTLTVGKLMPTYDLAKVTAPVSLFYAAKDILVHPDGVTQLKSKLPNVVRTVRIADEETSHIDFAFGTQAKKYIYDDVFALMKQYS